MNNNKVCVGCGASNGVNDKFCSFCGLQFNQVDNNIQPNMYNNGQPYMNNNMQSMYNNGQPNMYNNGQPYMNNNGSPDMFNNNQAVNVNENASANKLAILSLVLYFSGATIFTIISVFVPEPLSKIFISLGGISSPAGIILMIYGRVKYPKNKLTKIAMWIIIGSFLLYILIYVLFWVWCFSTLAGCS